MHDGQSLLQNCVIPDRVQMASAGANQNTPTCENWTVRLLRGRDSTLQIGPAMLHDVNPASPVLKRTTCCCRLCSMQFRQNVLSGACSNICPEQRHRAQPPEARM